MEKEEQTWEQAVAEMEEQEQQEEEESTLVVRKSRKDNEIKITEVAGVDDDDGEVSTNGASESNGPAENEAKNEDLLTNPANEQKKIEQELDGVIESGPEAINGDQKKENLVFFDKAQGLWKCRICTWTYRNGSVCVDHIQNHKALQYIISGVEKQILKIPGHEKSDISSSLDFVAHDNSTTAINNKYEGDLENTTSSQEHSTSYSNVSSKEIESDEADDLIDDDGDLEVKELDVERVIKKQTTHDLYCPNCNSCITRRVILRKRKRRIRISDDDEEVKRNKSGTSLVQSRRGDHVHHTDAVDDNDTRVPTVAEDEREGGPDIFKCLSCFSFFIPAGNGFKLFKIFGDKTGKEKIEDERAPPSVQKNWFASMFASNKLGTAVEQGCNFDETGMRQGDYVRVISSSNIGDQSGYQPSFLQNAPSPARASEEALEGPAGNDYTPEGRDNILPFPNQKPSLYGNLTETVDATLEQFESYTDNQLKESKSSKDIQVCENDLSVTTLSMRTRVTNGESVEDDDVLFSHQGGLKLLISSNNGPVTLGNSEEGHLITNQTMQSGDKEAIQLSFPVSELKASDVDGNLNISVSIPHQEQDVRATILTESVLENKNANFSSIEPSGHVHVTEASQHIITKTEIEVHSGEPLKVDNISLLKGKDTVINIIDSASLLQSSIHQTNVAGRETNEEREEYGIEVIKSIVYGGLAESITSLSVVSSAAGGGAATLNILALGMANLIGGLFVICHNLWELKCDRIEQVTNEISDQVTEQRDRYKELFGRRQNFILHAILSIISYVIFGLVPPVVYGFSFRKTDDKHLKLVVVGAASLVCIVVLAVGRAHVRRPPKHYLISVINFVVLGFMVSGVSYAAGELVERLLEKLGLFETGSVTNLLVNETMRPMGSAWASY